MGGGLSCPLWVDDASIYSLMQGHSLGAGDRAEGSPAYGLFVI